MQKSSYSLSVRVNDRTVEEFVDHKNQTYIEGRRGSNYELLFKNNSSQRKLVIFSVDGLSVVDGKPASDQSRGYVVEAWDSLTVPGWTVNESKVAKFEFQPQGDRKNPTYVEELKKEGFNVDTTNQGVIGCMIITEKSYPAYFGYPQARETYTKGSAIYNYYQTDAYNSMRGIACSAAAPPFIGLMNASGFAPASSFSECATAASYMGQNAMQAGRANAAQAEPALGTGFGADHGFATRSVSFERGAVELMLTIQYETREKLRKMGLIHDKTVESQAFPGFNENFCHVPNKRSH